MYFFLLLPGAILAPILHEWVKARVSTALGDNTPLNSGFSAFRPLRYFEPIGFLLMLSYGVGWGQPVPTSPLNYKNRRMGTMLTYSAPILANLLVGMIAAFLLSTFQTQMMSWAILNGDFAYRAMMHFGVSVFLFAQVNVSLAVFNLIPVFPLAGSRLLQLFVSPQTAITMSMREKQMLMLLMLALILGAVEIVIFPIRDAILGLVVAW